MNILGEVVEAAFDALLQGGIERLPKPLRIGCWAILGAMVLAVIGLVVWAQFK